MVLFDRNNKIRKYEKVEDILQDFYELRLEYYEKRKTSLLDCLSHDLLKLSNQSRFILMIIEEKIIINRRKKIAIVEDLIKHKFDVWFANDNAKAKLTNRIKAIEESNNNAGNDDNDNENDNKNEKRR